MKKLPLLFPAFLLLIFLFSDASPREKITIAVLDFDAKNMNQESADAVTDLLRTELFNTGYFKVVERQRIQKILEEQKFQVTGLTDADEVVEIGRLLNVKAILLGTVTRLGSTHIINTRMVSIRTGLVVLAESCERSGGEGQLPGAITELATNIANKIGLEGAIIHVEKKSILVDLGKVDGIEVGEMMTVIRLGEAITDLEGRVIGTRDEVIGTLEVTKVEEAYSEAKIKKKTENFQRGDKVKPLVEGQIPQLAKKEKEKKPKDKKKVDVPVIF